MGPQDCVAGRAGPGLTSGQGLQSGLRFISWPGQAGPGRSGWAGPIGPGRVRRTGQSGPGSVVEVVFGGGVGAVDEVVLEAVDEGVE
jgi:hypothetical protein